MSGLIVVDEAMHELVRELDRVAATAVSVLLEGEPGTGKDRLASELHARSARREKPILRLKCGAHSEQTLGTELFGHEQGAFEGALRRKDGILDMASGGTVFLDELDRLPPTVQDKLVLAVDRREFVRLGETEPRPLLVRFVASATAIDQARDRGTFRGDLLLLLSGVTLRVPPLRERPRDILPLAEAFASELAVRRNAEPPVFSDGAADVLLGYSWPGNVRELRTTVEQAVLACGTEAITPTHLSIGAFGQVVS